MADEVLLGDGTAWTGAVFLEDDPEKPSMFGGRPLS